MLAYTSRPAPVEIPSRVLTQREAEVLDMVADAADNRDIAFALGISENTVKVHICRILDKTGMSTRIELAVRHLTHRHRAELESLSRAA